MFWKTTHQGRFAAMPRISEFMKFAMRPRARKKTVGRVKMSAIFMKESFLILQYKKVMMDAPISVPMRSKITKS